MACPRCCCCYCSYYSSLMRTRMTTSFAKRRASSSSWHHFFFFFFFVVDEVDEDVRDYDRNTKNTTSKKERKSQPFLCVCPHKNAKAVASVFATDDQDVRTTTKVRQQCVRRVCFDAFTPLHFFFFITFSLLHFKKKILLFFSYLSSSTKKNKK